MVPGTQEPSLNTGSSSCKSLAWGWSYICFFVKHLEKEGTRGQSPGPGCHICLSRHTPPNRAPSWERQAAHGRLCRKCQPHLAKRSLRTLMRPLRQAEWAGSGPGPGLAPPGPRLSWSPCHSTGSSPWEVALNAAWGRGAVSPGAGLKCSWWVGSWAGSASSKGCPGQVPSGCGLRAGRQNKLTLTQPLTS